LHIVTIVLGHINHSNVKITYGPLKYLINNPVMHLWHHAKELPAGNTKGVNYGISLSLWDYLFGTAYIPNENENLTLGFDHVEEYPKTFLQQLTHPWKKK
jgi:sterol desaturase/sphingolipid hydroxylase (fatty acid hydroxylase superfamily)